MNDQPNHPVDSLVKSWLASQEPGPGQLTALRNRILEAAERERVGKCLALPPRRGQALRRWLLWGVCGAASAVLCAALGMLLSRPKPQDPLPIAAAAIPPEARLDREQVLLQAKLFARMNEVFAGRLAWIAESDSQVELGVEARTPGTDNVRPIAVRLVVMERARGEAAWRRCWSTDLMLENEQAVALKPQALPGRKLSFWAHVLPDGMIAVDATLQFSPSCPEMIYSGVEKPGAPETVFRWKTEGREYEAFQTVILLPAEVG